MSRTAIQYIFLQFKRMHNIHQILRRLDAPAPPMPSSQLQAADSGVLTNTWLSHQCIAILLIPSTSHGQSRRHHGRDTFFSSFFSFLSPLLIRLSARHSVYIFFAHPPVVDFVHQHFLSFLFLSFRRRNLPHLAGFFSFSLPRG